MADSYDTFPSHEQDPRSKDYAWILQYLRAAWGESKAFIPSTVLFPGRARLTEIKQYALGKQSISKYKKILLGDDQTNKSEWAIDWNPVALLPKYREIAISNIIKRNLEAEAFAVDPLAKSEEDEYFNQLKVKAMMREAAQKQQSELADSPVLQPAPNEPKDMEQIMMQQKYGYKHQKAMESEIGISLIHEQNDFDEKRKRNVENLYDFGLGGYTRWIDYNGMVKFKEVSAEDLVVSYCREKDFSDMVHWGRVMYVTIADLAPYFNADQLKHICDSVAGKYGNMANPIINTTDKAWYRFKVAVFDCKFISWNTTVYKKEIDGNSNIRTNKSDYKNLGRTDNIEFFKGQPEPKYIDSTRKVVYKGKWLIGSDMMYDWGLSENMNRKPSSWWDTSLNVDLYAWNFHEMLFGGVTERLIPIEDNLCQTWYKIQNMKNKLIPYLIKIDVSALEGVNFGKGGKKMKPEDLVDFMYEEFVFLYRRHELLSNNQNYDPAKIEATGQLQALITLLEEFKSGVELMKQISGLNDATDASTINPKSLTTNIQAQMQSTNNALHLIMEADRHLVNKLNDGIVQDIQIAVKLGRVEGYAKALGDDTVRFYQINPNISNYELGIFTSEAISPEERQAFYQDLNLKDSQGLVDPAMKIIIMSCRNLKQATELLAYHVAQKEEMAHARQMQLVQAQTDGNTQAAQALEAAKQDTIIMQGEIDLQKIAAEAEANYYLEMLKKGADIHSAEIQAHGRNIANAIMAHAKIESTKITAKSRPKKTG